MSKCPQADSSPFTNAVLCDSFLQRNQMHDSDPVENLESMFEEESCYQVVLRGLTLWNPLI